MADNVIINEQNRTGILPYEEMMAKASATVATPDPSADAGVDLSAYEPAGNTPGKVSGMSATADEAQGKHALMKPAGNSPFTSVKKSIAPFTVMSPQIDIRDFISPKGTKPGYHNLTAQQWVAGKSGGKKAARGRGKSGNSISLFNTYKGGLDDIRGTAMQMRMTPEGQLRVTMGMLDPKLRMALEKEREKQMKPDVVPDAKALTNEDFRQLTQHNNQAHRQKLGI